MMKGTTIDRWSEFSYLLNFPTSPPTVPCHVGGNQGERWQNDSGQNGGKRIDCCDRLLPRPSRMLTILNASRRIVCRPTG